jgi:hypothetical protein
MKAHRKETNRPPMNNAKFPPLNLREWVEFYWLLIVDPTFQKSHDKRKAYFEYRVGKVYNCPCY